MDLSDLENNLYNQSTPLKFEKSTSITSEKPYEVIHLGSTSILLINIENERHSESANFAKSLNLSGEKLGKVGKSWEELVKMGQSREKWEKVGKNGEKLGKVGKSGKKWEKVGKVRKTEEKLWKVGKNGEKWEKVGKSG